MSIARANELCDRCATQERRDPQLVASGEEYSRGLLETLQPARLLTIPTRIEIHDGHACGAELGKQFLVTRSRLMQSACRRNDDNVRRLATGDAHEPLEDPAVVLLVLRATDRNDPTARLTFWNFTWHTPSRLS